MTRGRPSKGETCRGADKGKEYNWNCFLLKGFDIFDEEGKEYLVGGRLCEAKKGEARRNKKI